MAARRLIVVLVVLLAISTAVAIIAPQPAQREAPRTSAEVEQPLPEDAGWHEPNLSSRLHTVVDDEDGKPKRIAALVGDQLRLDVEGDAGRVISIPDLGLTATQSRTAPASFDILLTRAGNFPVFDAGNGEQLARIEVRGTAGEDEGAEAGERPRKPSEAEPGSDGTGEATAPALGELAA